MTRAEYMTRHENETDLDARIRHHEYYMQFAKALKSSCSAFCMAYGYSADFIRERYAKDRNLNNLELGWMTRMDHWVDENKSAIAHVNFKLNGTRTYCLADGPCILKAYMRNIAGVDHDA